MKKISCIVILIISVLLVACGNIKDNKTSVDIDGIDISLGMTLENIENLLQEQNYKRFYGQHFVNGNEYYDTCMACSQIEIHYSLMNFHDRGTVLGQKAFIDYYFNEDKLLQEIYIDDFEDNTEVVYNAIKEIYGEEHTTDWIELVGVHEAKRWDLEDNTSLLLVQNDILIVTYTSDIEDIEPPSQ